MKESTNKRNKRNNLKVLAFRVQVTIKNNLKLIRTKRFLQREVEDGILMIEYSEICNHRLHAFLGADLCRYIWGKFFCPSSKISSGIVNGDNTMTEIFKKQLKSLSVIATLDDPEILSLFNFSIRPIKRSTRRFCKLKKIMPLSFHGRCLSNARIYCLISVYMEHRGHGFR